MAKKHKFLLLSLKEDKAKHLAKVISSNTARKILDFLADNPGVTATKVSQVLQIPLNTTTYNLKQLVKGGLIVSEEFHYSAKGREVDHYSLANQYIIIAPKESLAEKLKNVLPIGGVLLSLAAGATLWFQNMTGTVMRAAPAAAPVFEEAVVGAADVAVDEAAKTMAAEAAPAAAPEVVAAVPEAVATVPWLQYVLIALIAIVFLISAFLIIRKIVKK